MVNQRDQARPGPPVEDASDMQPVTSATHRPSGLDPTLTPLQPGLLARRQTPSAGEQAAEPARDRVELSAAAASAQQTAPAESVDQLVQDVRARITAGTYLTPDKIDVAVDRLYQTLFGL
jgi:anti-sigma28 factor (negative regulator of flagellin synthesis)